jgi:CxxC motif-containing protein (DUF1111 family)
MMKILNLKSALVLLVFLLTITACKKHTKNDASETTTTDDNEQYSGGTTTIFDSSPNAFSHAAPVLPSNGYDMFEVGHSFFHDNWIVAPGIPLDRDGIGPIMNSSACSGCHSSDGRGRPPITPGEDISSILFRLSISGTDAYGGPLGDPQYGTQLGNHAILNVTAEGTVTITYTVVDSTYQDGTPYSLSIPSYQFINLGYGNLASGSMFSPRVAPQMPGMGLLEAISDNTLLSWADPNDSNGDGISGRTNYVQDYVNNKTSIGRFGWKANQPNVQQQVAGALIGDMGLTTSLFPIDNLTGQEISLYSGLPNGGTPEVTDTIFNYMVYYSATLAVPGRRNWTNPTVQQGKQLFVQLNCSGCHKPYVQTGTHPTIPQLSNQEIRPYTDLLLHDMGAGLADNRPDFLATGQEWRTPPLWGIGLIPVVNGHTFYLHDGRARNIEEAVLWHGGEAQGAVNKFKRLSNDERAALLTFLNSL